MTSQHDVVSDALAELAALPAEVGVSLATLVTYRGETIADQYASMVSVSTQLISWSIAKTLVQALVGVCVRDGKLRLDQRAPVPEWANDERASRPRWWGLRKPTDMALTCGSGIGKVFRGLSVHMVTPRNGWSCGPSASWSSCS